MILEGNTLNSKLLLTLRVFDSWPYRYRGYIKSIIENIPISRPNDEAKEGWSVGRLASFHPRFSCPNAKEALYGYTLLKKWFLYILLWPHSQSYGIWLIYSPRASDISYYWVFFAFSHFHEHELHHFDSLKYPGFLPTHADLIFLKNYFPVDRWTRNRNISDDRLILPLILPSTIFIALSLFLNHDRSLFILRPERLVCSFLLWMFPILG